MNGRRTTARVTIAAGLLALSGLMFAAPAAGAKGDSVTIAGTSSLTVSKSSGQQLSIDATAAATCEVDTSLGTHARTVTLSLIGPSGPDSTSTLLSSVSKSCAQPVPDSSLGKSISVPARNGDYTAALVNGGSTSANLLVVVPPAAPAGFSVTTSGMRATFSWHANSEPDITGYDVTGPNGPVTQVGPSACSGTSCSTTVDFGSSVAGNSESFAVHALRCGASCASGDQLAGASSASTTATFAAAATPTPNDSSTPSGGGHGVIGGGPSGGIGSSGGHKTSSGHSNKPGTGGVPAGGTQLQAGGTGSVPSFDSGDIPAFDVPSLHIHRQTVKQLPGGDEEKPNIAKSNGAKADPASSITTTTSGLTSLSLWRAIAAAAVLLLLAVHLRTWVARHDPSGL